MTFRLTEAELVLHSLLRGALLRQVRTLREVFLWSWHNG